jgi:hypothetical protein
MERAMWQNAVFKAKLNDERENAARSTGSDAQVLRGVAQCGGHTAFSTIGCYQSSAARRFPPQSKIRDCSGIGILSGLCSGAF